jgi:hypothetical protein
MIREAVERYRTFTAKEPDFVTALEPNVQLPPRLGASGRARRIWYVSGKWRNDGGVGYYVHDYSTPVEFCEAFRPSLRPVVTPRWPKELALLGECIALEVERSGELAYPRLPSPTLLPSTPDGRALVLLGERRGILAVLLGGAQRITERGIEG